VTQQADSKRRHAAPGTWAYRSLTAPVRDTLGRYRVVKRLAASFDVILGPLALIAVSLLIVELLVRLASPWNTAVYGAQLAIWALFLLAFVVELSLAPKKLLYLKRNWFLVIALIVPALRILRFARALRFLRSAPAMRSANVVRGLVSTNRAFAAVSSFLGFSQLALLAAVTCIVWLAASGLVYYLESGSESGIDSVSDALWWAAAVLTTVSINNDPTTGEGRFVAIVLRIFGVAVIGYFTARMAAFFFGNLRSASSAADGEVAALRREIAALREELKERRSSREPG
jgi:voltage-gated potassium channel